MLIFIFIKVAVYNRFSLQWMAAGVSGANGQCALQTVRGSAAESAQLQSPNMVDVCVTGWHWQQTTAPVACAHRVGNNYKRKRFSVISVSPVVFRDFVIIDLLMIIFGSMGNIVITIIIVFITSTVIHLHYSSPHQLSVYITRSQKVKTIHS